MNEGTERRCASRIGYRLKPPITCIECGDVATSDARGWRGYRTDEPEMGDLPAVAFYCADCAEREFG